MLIELFFWQYLNYSKNAEKTNSVLFRNQLKGIYTYICEDIWYKGKHHDAKKHYNNKPETVI
jgi:hypothetical protein